MNSPLFGLNGYSLGVPHLKRVHHRGAETTEARGINIGIKSALLCGLCASVVNFSFKFQSYCGVLMAASSSRARAICFFSFPSIAASPTCSS